MSEYTQTDRELQTLAQQTLRRNDVGGFIKPAGRQYPHIWNWDVAFVAIGLSNFDVPRALKEIGALLQGQWGNGLVPHILYPNGASDYFPTPDFWQIATHPQRPAMATSGLTQPPVLATALRMVHDRIAKGDRHAQALVRRFFVAILEWHRWLYRARDPEHSGLVVVIHPWEVSDNSPRFRPILDRLTLDRLPEYTRRDKRHVNADERPLARDYDCFVWLIGRYRDLHWDDEAIYAQAPIRVRDVMFNAILHQANQDLLVLAQALGEPSAEIETWIARTHAAFDDLWDEAAGYYVDRDLQSGEYIRILTAMTFIPLYAGLADTAQARRLIETHLLNGDSFAPTADSRYYVPTVAKNSPYYHPRRYWSGPVWINMNWFVWRGLLRYGYDDLAETIRTQTLQLIADGGCVEYYDPRDGSPCGARDFSWSAALALELLRGKTDSQSSA